MSRKQVLRAEETKKAILSEAGKLFAEQGFHAVTMREIAKKAGCSHTTIYIYFTDKETLLYQLSMPPLKELQHLDHVGAIKKILQFQITQTDPYVYCGHDKEIFYSAACSKRMEKLIKAKGCFPLALILSIYNRLINRRSPGMCHKYRHHSRLCPHMGCRIGLARRKVYLTYCHIVLHRRKVCHNRCHKRLLR
jgi:hypothetical protein